MAEDSLFIRHPTRIRGELPDTRAWLDRYERSRREVVAALRRIPVVVDTFRQLHPDELYRIVWSPEMMAVLRDGSAVWKRSKDGFLSVVLRKPGGEIVKHLSLDRVSPVQFAPLAQLATQSMLLEVIERLEAIDQKVSAILHGQITDRLGALQGAEFQLMAALEASGEERRHLLRACAGPCEQSRGILLKNLRAKLKTLDLRVPGWWYIARYLPWKKSPGNLIREAMTEVHDYLLGAVRATRYLEVIYEELGQTASAKKALAVFGDEIKSVLSLGRGAAQWLPYDRTRPPEALWDQTGQMLEGPFRRAQGLLTAPDVEVEIEVATSDIVGSEVEQDGV